MIKRDLNTIN